jgi:hypothetical protein
MGSSELLGLRGQPAPSPTIRALEVLRPRQRLVYHVGYLPNDRRDPKIAEVADAAWHLSEVGRIILVQRRQREDLYEYLAIGRVRD